ncbi:MAG: hypothetical protein AB1665_06580 [Candidatus Thermoplasmatota archaeon]
MKIAPCIAVLLGVLIAWDISLVPTAHLFLYLVCIGAAALWLHPVSCAALQRAPRTAGVIHAVPAVLLGIGHLGMRELSMGGIAFDASYLILLMLLYELQEWHARLLGIPYHPETMRAARILAGRLLVRYTLLTLASWAVISLGILLIMRLTEIWSLLVLAICTLLIIVVMVHAAYRASSSGGASSSDRYWGGISSTR